MITFLLMYGRKRVASQVISVQLDQVEGVEKHFGVVPPIADAVEARHAVVVTAHRLAVAIERVADALLVDEETQRIAPACEILRPRP